MSAGTQPLERPHLVAVALAILGAAAAMAASTLGLKIAVAMVAAPALALIAVLVLRSASAFLWLVALLPLQNVLVMDIGFWILPSYLMAVLLLGREVLRGRLRSLTPTPVNGPLSLFLLVAFASTGLALLEGLMGYRTVVTGLGSRYGLWRPAIQLAVLLVFAGIYALTLVSCRSRKSLHRALKTYLVVATVVASYALYQQLALALTLPLASLDFLGSVRETAFVTRSNSTFMEPLNLGHYLLGPLGLTLALAASARSQPFFRPRSIWVMLGVLLGGLLSTVSGGAFLGFGVTATFFFLVLMRQRRTSGKRWLLWLLAFSAGLLLLAWFSPGPLENIKGRILFVLQQEFASREETVVLGLRRVDYLLAALRIFLDNPVLGVGLGRAGEELLRRAPELVLVAGITSVPLNVMAELGILGLVAFSWLAVSFVRPLVAGMRRPSLQGHLSLGFLAGFLGFMAQYSIGLGDVRMDPYLWFYLGLGMAFVHLSRAERSAP